VVLSDSNDETEAAGIVETPTAEPANEPAEELEEVTA
jgi:hypothetical protein